MWWVLLGVGGGLVVAFVAVSIIATAREWPTVDAQARDRARVPREPVTLRQAADRGLVPLTLDALRRASTRDPRFPAALGFGPRTAALYRPAELVDWHATRPGSPTRLRPRSTTVDHRLAVAQRQRGEDARARRRRGRVRSTAGR